MSLGVTRFRHRENLEPLSQYVVEEQPFKPTASTVSRPGPPVIKLDDPVPAPAKPKDKAWSAPNIAVYLSKIELPDLKGVRKDGNSAKAGQLRQGAAPTAAIADTGTGARISGSTGPSANKNGVKPNKVPPAKLQRPSSNTTPAIPADRPPPPTSHIPSRPPPPSVSPQPTPSEASANSGIVSLTRLFKAAASKV